MTAYPFRQGIDYGPRDGSLGIGFHMTEGNGGIGDVTYLARRTGETLAAWRTRVRGVSAHVVIIDDGTVWQMVDFDNAAGSFDPDHRNNATTGYYNGTVIRAVLGAHYVDPNAWSIVAEIAGKRATGPTIRQVNAAIAWAQDMKARYPTLRGAFGHADQTDTKGCPGLSPNMRAIFAGIGGHGLWSDDVQAAITDLTPKIISTAPDSYWYELDGTTRLPGTHIALTGRLSPYGAAGKRAIYVTPGGGARRLVLVNALTMTDPPDNAAAKLADAGNLAKQIVTLAGG